MRLALMIHAVGLDSGLQLSEVQRKPLNLVALLDYSGSMGSPFNLYYYDRFGAQQQLKPEGKCQAAEGCVPFLRHVQCMAMP